MDIKDLSKVLEELFEGAYIVDKHRKILFWNNGAEKITGYSEKDVKNSFCYNNILRHVDDNGKELCLDGCPLEKTLITGQKQENNVYLHHKKGHRIPVIVRTSPIYDEKGNISGVLEMFTDSRYKHDLYQENRRLLDLTVKDELTRAYNRRFVDYQIKSLVSEFEEFRQTFGIIYLDIDDFKKVNDTFGHLVGDEVLKLISRTVNSNVRDEDIFGRYGGEEFIVIVKCLNEKELEHVANKLRILIQKSSLIIDDALIETTVSMGGAMFHSGESIEAFINKADKAMYHSKQTGKNKVTIY